MHLQTFLGRSARYPREKQEHFELLPACLRTTSIYFSSKSLIDLHHFSFIISHKIIENRELWNKRKIKSCPMKTSFWSVCRYFHLSCTVHAGLFCRRAHRSRGDTTLYRVLLEPFGSLSPAYSWAHYVTYSENFFNWIHIYFYRVFSGGGRHLLLRINSIKGNACFRGFTNYKTGSLKRGFWVMSKLAVNMYKFRLWEYWKFLFTSFLRMHMLLSS